VTIAINNSTEHAIIESQKMSSLIHHQTKTNFAFVSNGTYFATGRDLAWIGLTLVKTK